jgi:hypothetical protein
MFVGCVRNESFGAILAVGGARRIASWYPKLRIESGKVNYLFFSFIYRPPRVIIKI